MSAAPWWEELPLWHGVPMPGRHLCRPWWRDGGAHATRTDGVCLKRGFERYPREDGSEPQLSDPGRWVYRVAWHSANKRGPEGWSVEGVEWPEALAAYDAAHPLPCPPPVAGQVWALACEDGSVARIVVGSDYDPPGPGGELCTVGTTTFTTWPPDSSMIELANRAYLLSGAFAPWGPEADPGGAP